MAAGLVFMMQAGFLLLEAGLVRSKNSINVAQKNIADFVIACAVFGALGFMLMFGASSGGWIGVDSNLFMFNEVPDWTFTFFVFQVVFCGTAATIVSGGMAERMKFSGYLITTVFIAALVYPVFGHWAWGNLLVSDNEPFLAAQGFIDFAGSTVVHSIGAWIALAGVIVLGPRIGKFCNQGKPQQITGHSAMLATLGAIILWVGWIGFNGGSTTAGTPDFAHVVSNTMVAGAFGGIASMFLGRYMDGIYRPERCINGVLAGLVAITAGCDAVTTWGAIAIGFSGGIVGYVGYLIIEHWFKLDDAVGVIPVHGFAGAWGTILLAVLATEDKLAVASRWEQFFVQCEGVALGFMWAFGTGYVFFKLMDALVGIRVSEEDEIEGLNAAEHGTTLGTGHLQKALQELASGQGNLTKRLDTTTGDEAADLGYSFNLFMDKLQELVSGIAGHSEQLAEFSKSLGSISGELGENAFEVGRRTENTNNRAGAVVSNVRTMADTASSVSETISSVSNNAERVSDEVGVVFENIQAMTAAVQEISENAHKASEVAGEAKRKTSEASVTVTTLSEAVDRVGVVIGTISEIAAQTNLLALNATIEAQHAGAAGKGFAVVAAEVKNLAKATADATKDISDRIVDIQSGAKDAVSVISGFTDVVQSIDEGVMVISSAVEEQTAVANTIQESAGDASEHVGEISSAIASVAEKIQGTSGEASHAAEGTDLILDDILAVRRAAERTTANSQQIQTASRDASKVAREFDKVIDTLGVGKVSTG